MSGGGGQGESWMKEFCGESARNTWSKGFEGMRAMCFPTVFNVTSFPDERSNPQNLLFSKPSSLPTPACLPW